METYHKIYNTPVNHISVPVALRETGFEVHFTPLNTMTKPLSKNPKKGAGSLMRAYFTDIPLPNAPEDDFELPERKVYCSIEII